MTTLPLPRNEVNFRDLGEAIRGLDKSLAELDRIAAATGLSRSQVYQAIREPHRFYAAFCLVADFYGWRQRAGGGVGDPYFRRAA
jgi:hypothetical protein